MNTKKAMFAKRTKAFRSYSVCLHPDAPDTCTGKIIESHTVQRNSALSEIAYGKKKEVYVMEADPGQLFKQGRITPKKKGISKSTTFKGFCQEHDRTFFSDIENKGFSGSREQCFCLYYRAVVKQYYDKIVTKKFTESFLEEDDLVQQTIFQYSLQPINLDILELKDEIENAKKLYHNKNFAQVRHIILEFERPINVMGCACFGLAKDFDGNAIQDVSMPNNLFDYEPVKNVCVNFFASKQKGYVLLSWPKNYDTTFMRLADQLEHMDNQKRTDSLIYFILDHAENIAMGVEWYEGLSTLQRQEIERLCAPNIQSQSPTTMKNLDLWKLQSFDIL